MINIINFKIEKLLTQAGVVSGYFVILSKGDQKSNPLAGIMEMMGENIGEKWKEHNKPEQKFFFATEKEIIDYMAYQLTEFKDGKL